MNRDWKLSELGKTWIVDLDGTVVYHNQYLLEGDCFLPGAREWLESLPEEDMLIFITSRKEEWREQTENFLRQNNICYHSIIFGAPYGERIVINDIKPSGLQTAWAVNMVRDCFELP